MGVYMAMRSRAGGKELDQGVGFWVGVYKDGLNRSSEYSVLNWSPFVAVWLVSVLVLVLVLFVVFILVVELCLCHT